MLTFSYSNYIQIDVTRHESKNPRAVPQVNFRLSRGWSWIKRQCSYRVSLAGGSYWSSENPLDVPQLSVMQMGGTDHNVVARHWIRLLFKYFWDRNVCKNVFPLLLRPLPHLSPALLIPSPLLYKVEEEPAGVSFPSHPLNANLFPLFSKFLWLSAHLPFSFCLLFKYFTSCSSFTSFSCLPLVFYF